MTLKEIRKKRNIMQHDMAKEMGISLKQFQRYEQGSHMPPFDKAVIWAEELKLTLNKFRNLVLNKEEVK